MESLNKKHKLVLSAVLSGLIVSPLLAADNDDKRYEYLTIKGYAGTFSKIGFNNSYVDKDKGIYPTESFVSMVGKVDAIFDINKTGLSLPEGASLTFGLGVTAGGLAYDSTRNDRLASDHNTIATPGGLAFNYVGYYGGYDGHITPTGNNTVGMLIHNAYADWESKYLHIKLGRYESSMDYFSGYTQGFNIDFPIIYGAGGADNYIKPWVFGSYGRAFAYSEWIYTYYVPKDISGVYAAGVDVSYGGFNDNSGVSVGNSVLLRPFVYYSNSIYTAPGVKLVYDAKRNLNGMAFGSKTTINTIFPILDNSQYHDKDGNVAYRYGDPVGSGAWNLNIIEELTFNNYNAGFGIYKNFGNANAHIGTYGNPINIDYWTASVYEIGQSITNVISANALTGYIFGGGVHKLGIGDFNWNVISRLTFSPRANEQSVSFFVSQSFKNNITVGLKLEWQSVTTHAGYKVGESGKVSGQTAENTQDRSHAFFTVDYNF